MPVNINALAVPTEKLRRICDPVKVEAGENTATGLGQSDALSSMEVGLQMIADEYARSHYNIVVSGPANTGRTARTVRFLRERAEREECYPHAAVSVNDFDSPRHFIVAFVPQGTTEDIEEMMNEFVQVALMTLPDEIEGFRNREMQKAELIRREMIEGARKRLLAMGLEMKPEEHGIGLFPIIAETVNRPMTKDEFLALDDEERDRLKELIALEGKMLSEMVKSADPSQIVKMLPQIDVELQKKGLILINDAEKGVFIFAMITDTTRSMTPEEFEKLDSETQEKVSTLISSGMNALDEIMKPFGDLIGEILQGSLELAKTHIEKMLSPVRELVGDDEAFSEFHRYLDGLTNIIAMFVARPRQDQGPISIMGGGGDKSQEEMMQLKHLCEILTLVDEPDLDHKPVVHVEVPSFSELFGRINAEPTGRDSYRIDHTMVEGGAILKANGGYLVIDLNDLLRWGGGIAFYKLLEVIRTRKLTIESKSSFVDAEGLINYRSNEIPLDIRVAAVCSPYLEMMLRQVEPEFENLFRITSEFAHDMPFEEAPTIYGQFVEMCRATSDLPKFTPEAIAKLVEYGARRVDDQAKCSTELGIIKDIVTEAAHWSRQNGAHMVSPCHVKQAIKARFDRRALRVRRYQEFLDSGHILISHEGEKIGQVNGLAVMGLSQDVKFGVPMRLTARCFAGKEKVLLVQRKAKLTGKSTDMSIEDITGYLSGKYGRKKALSLAVQLSFEQTYGGIDGDSASLATVAAIISAIIERPIDQMKAVTGSMNQWGEVQPIGGVNEKIEGHFGALNRRGLLQKGHGAIIPVQNVNQLMLDDEVIEAHRRGLYSVQAVTHVDEVLEILIKLPIAEIDQLVEEKLAEMNEEEDRDKKSKKKKTAKK